jgi:class 3 adenylate cyclase
MTIKQKQALSFYRKIRISLGLMGVLPFLMVSYLLMAEEITLSNTMIISSALILFSILMGFTLLRKSADQLSLLAQETSSSKKQNTIAPVHLHIDGELKDIASNFNNLVERLDLANQDIQEQNIQLLRYADDLDSSYEQLKKEELLRTQLSRYIGNDLVEQMMDSDGEILLKNQRKVVTILFADIRSFTRISENMAPENVVDMLNEYFTLMVEIIFKNNGVLDKFVGDQLMAVFGHISGEGKGAKYALLAALEMQQAIDVLMEERKKKHLPIFQTGIGINTGSVLIGNVGSENRMDYTVIGDTVNAAARLEEQALGGEIIIGEQTLDHLPKTIKTGERLKLKVKNRTQPITCYSIALKKTGSTRELQHNSAEDIALFQPGGKTAVAF